MSDLTHLRLRVFRNPMRSDGVFVAEDKPIRAYPGARGFDGLPLFPAVPQDGVSLGYQVEPELARRIVACVNACAGHTTEELELVRRAIEASGGAGHAILKPDPTT